MEKLPQKKRIEFIDLAKGICILLVVMLHCGGPARALPGFELVRMPLYFVLSGLFYKDYGGIKHLIVKKTNKLIIPYIFFLIVPYLLGVLFYGKGIFNIPIWFLVALFWCNILFFFINKFIKSDVGKIFSIIALAFVGYSWFKVLPYNFLYLDISLSSLPFFCAGYYLKKSPILYKNKYDKFNLLIALSFWIVSLFSYKVFSPTFDLYARLISGVDAYLISFCSVISILFICKFIRWVPLISFIGRYSIVILCTHYCFIQLWITYLKIIPKQFQNLLLLFFLIMAISTLCIPLFRRYIPQFIAQKDIIGLDSAHKIKIIRD